jgi:hypothetical protein
MNTRLKISFFAALFLCSTAALAQTDSTANKVLKKVIEALVNGDCDRAQRNYNIWKEFAAKTNPDIETEIKACKSEKKQDKGYVELKDADIAVQTKDIVVSKLYYDDAKLLCEGSTLGGYKDWRLPTIVELSAIFTDKDKLFNVSQSGSYLYWSSSIVVSNNESAKNKNASVKQPIYKLMRMSDGQLTTSSDSWRENYCRCVRSINEK